jgi:hypothetical protein
MVLLEEWWEAEPELARSHRLFLCGREVSALLEVAANNVVSMKRSNREEVTSR